jgi:hypothetical protein
LREPCGGQLAGAVGAVVELLPKEALVEIADEHGRMVELLTSPTKHFASESQSQSFAEPPDNPAGRGSYLAG